MTSCHTVCVHDFSAILIAFCQNHILRSMKRPTLGEYAGKEATIPLAIATLIQTVTI